MKIALLHLRMAISKWALLPLIAIGLLLLFQRNRFWIGIWPETGAALGLVAFFFSLFSAGIAAWASARTDVFRVRELTSTSVKREMLLDTFRFLATLFWPVLAYMAMIIVAAFVTSKEGAPGILAFGGYVLLGLFLIVMAAACGWAVGKVTSPTFASLGAFFGWFLFISVVGPPVDANPMSGPPWIEVSLPAILMRFFALLILIAAACVLPSRSSPKPRATGIVALAAAFSVVVVALAGTTVLRPRAPISQPQCLRLTIEYCLWPEHKKYIGMVRHVDEQVAALPRSLTLPHKIVDYSLSGSTVMGPDGIEREIPGPHDPEFDISEGSRWALARSVAAAITQSVFTECEYDADRDKELGYEQIRAWLEYRLAGGGTPDYTTNAPGDLQNAWKSGQKAAQTLTAPQQAAWAHSLIRSTRSKFCGAR